MNLFANYQVGLVLSCVGMNDVQHKLFHARLQEIARAGGAEPDGLRLIVPTVLDHTLHSAYETTERLVGQLGVIPWLRIEIVEAQNAPQALGTVRDCDEVWCASSRGQGERNVRPGRVYAQGQYMKNPGRFKMLHYWAELEPETPKPQPKGNTR